MKTKIPGGGLALAATLIVGCGSGSGAPSDPLRPYDPPQPSNDYPSGNSQATQGSPQPGGESGCPVCRMYSCVVGGQSSTITLSSAGGGDCTFTSNGAQLTLACGGSVTQNGQPAGNWTQAGGGIVLCQGQSCVTCN